MIVSDHGFGGTGDQVIHLNRWLATQGWLTFARPSLQERLMGWGKKTGLLMPATLQEWAFRSFTRRLVDRIESRSRLGGIDWGRSVAFSEEVNTLPGIWLNVRGREPQGQVAPGHEYERLRDEIIARLGELKHPRTGESVIQRAHRREEVYHGPWVDLSPDVVLEPALDRGYAYTFLSSRGRPGAPLRTLAPHERLGSKGGSMNGSHRSDGVLILAGNGVVAGQQVQGASLLDIAPTLYWLLGVPPPVGTEGRALTEAFEESKAVPCPAAQIESPGEAQPYSQREAAIVQQRLRDLGYRE
jgi:predicted AlkP superfamily phosphohydrolase/phosphomutase